MDMGCECREAVMKDSESGKATNDLFDFESKHFHEDTVNAMVADFKMGNTQKAAQELQDQVPLLDRGIVLGRAENKYNAERATHLDLPPINWDDWCKCMKKPGSTEAPKTLDLVSGVRG
jgi:hypothetical protein